MNQNSITKRNRPIVVEKPKELTAREKAIEFAKNNVPKPKQKSKEENELPKKLVQADEEDDDFGLDLNDRAAFNESKQKGANNYKSNNLVMLDQRHEAY